MVRTEIRNLAGLVAFPVPDQDHTHYLLEPGLPGSILYLHKLAENGSADAYYQSAGMVRVDIRQIDHMGHPSLRDVESVMLEYSKEK